MKTAIVEISESHEECIYSQLRFLKDARHHVTLILHPKLEKQISDYMHVADQIIYFDFENGTVEKNILLQWHLFSELKKYDIVLFNTAHSYSVIRNVSVLLRPFKIKCIGILHDVKKLQNSRTQQIISKKIKHYFVLNDALLPPEENTSTIELQSFYPIFFPKYDRVPVYKQNHIWVGIPGRIDYKRRNYDFLVNALSRIDGLRKVKFLILGKVDRNTPDGARLLKKIETSGQLKYFKFFHSFIDNQDFHAYLGACDFIMPLLRPNKDYLNTKISGAFNLAFAHEKPMLCSTFFRDIPDLKANSLFYDEASFNQIITDIDAGKGNPPTSYSDPKWTYDYQRKRYIDFINE